MKQTHNPLFPTGNSQKRALAEFCLGILDILVIDSCGNPAAAQSAGNPAGLQPEQYSAVFTPFPEPPLRTSAVDTTVVEFWRYPDNRDVEIVRGNGTGRVICNVRLPATPGQTGLQSRPARPRLDLLEPTIRQLLATISPLTQPRSEAWPERTTALLLTIPDASGRNVEILHRLTPATRHWATQSIHLLTACLTRMQLLPPLTPVPVANPGSSFGSSLGTGPNIGHHAAASLQSQSAAGLPAASM